MKETFLVGVAGEVVSPELGTPLYGYAFHRPARAVADDLMVKAVAVSQGDVQGILISADVVSISNELTDDADDRIIQENLKLIKKFNHYTVQKKHRFTHG